MAGTLGVTVAYYIFPHGEGWRVHSRGFTWDFALGAQAVAFASDMAEQYARASGQPTSVRYRDDAGAFHELRAFEATLPWLPPSRQAPETHEVRQATLLPFRRKAN
jgi:hypothetical protein